MSDSNNPTTAGEVATQVAAKTNAWVEKNIADGGVCDFCSRLVGDGPCATYTLSASIVERMIVVSTEDPADAAPLSQVNDEWWAACPDCDAVIQQKDPAALAQHVFATADYDRIGVPPERGLDVSYLTDLYGRFFAANPVRTDDIPPEAAAMYELQRTVRELVEETEIFGFEYPDYAAAKVAYDRNMQILGVEMGKRSCGASMWTAQDSTETKFLLLVADTRNALRDAGDFSDGVAYEMDDRETGSLMDRHVGIWLENAARGTKGSETHYGLGAEVRPGNDIRPRIGRDQ